ncbi:hypothetical protein HQ37_03590 [Porphyromonas sp. COT-239 OH1446]|nr:hypothetical protein HQ37_03590 [Porphyromonas sp. COT-239 OH1446]
MIPIQNPSVSLFRSIEAKNFIIGKLYYVDVASNKIMCLTISICDMITKNSEVKSHPVKQSYKNILERKIVESLKFSNLQPHYGDCRDDQAKREVAPYGATSLK